MDLLYCIRFRFSRLPAVKMSLTAQQVLKSDNNARDSNQTDLIHPFP